MGRKRCRFLCFILLVLLAAPQAILAADVRLKRSEQYGGARFDFRLRYRGTSNRCFVILPKKQAAAGSKTPWVWYAPVIRERYPNKWHGWFFTRLLSAGIAVCGIDIGESWGNPKGRADFSRFYDLVSQHKKFDLTPKACMFAESRGALMAYNWAVEHPKNIQCIAAIYPVCKITPTPFFARIYDLTKDEKQQVAELKTNFASHNPMDRLKPLADAKVPIMHLHGGEDKVVPAQSHSLELARRYTKLGGEITVMVRRGQRHEPSIAFFECGEFLDFLVAQAKAAQEDARKRPAAKTQAKDK